MPAIALTLLEHRADVIILSEWRQRTGGQIAGVLHDHGLCHQFHTQPGDGVNGVLVASRLELRQRVPTISLPGLVAKRSLSLRYLEVDLPEADMTIGAVHIPCDGPGRRAVIAAMVETARRQRDSACIVMGDMNAWRGELDADGTAFGVDRPSGEIGLGRLASLGYVDAWRAAHPGERDYTWHSHDGAGFRIDHAHVSRALATRVKRCDFSHEGRGSGLSDHSALVLEIDLAIVEKSRVGTKNDGISEKSGEKWFG
jgi:exodeoxyribonuclease-3